MKKISAKTVLALIALPTFLSFLFSCGNLFPAQIYFNDSVKTFGEKKRRRTCPIVEVGMPYLFNKVYNRNTFCKEYLK